MSKLIFAAIHGRFGHRGVALIVSVMLLIMMAILTSVAYYVYSTNLLGSLEGSTQPGYGNPQIEMITFSAGGSATITVRNIGTGPSTIVAIYVDGVQKYSSIGVVISPGQAQSFTLPNVSATQHRFSVRTADGGGVAVYGPQNIFFLVTLTTYDTVFTSTYSTGVNTMYSTQVATTSSSTSLTTPTTTSTQGSSTTTITSSFYATTSTRYYTTVSRGTTLTTSTRYYTTLTSTTITSTTTTLTTFAYTSGLTTRFFTTATATTPTTTISGPATTTVTTTVTTNAGSDLNPLWLAVLFLILPWSAIKSKLAPKTSLPRRRHATTAGQM